MTKAITMKNLIQALWEFVNEQFSSWQFSPCDCNSRRLAYVLDNGDSRRRGHCSSSYQLPMIWKPSFSFVPLLVTCAAKTREIREGPSSQMMDRCALAALEPGLLKIQEDIKCLFKPKWFHDNSSSIFLIQEWVPKEHLRIIFTHRGMTSPQAEWSTTSTQTT